MLEPFAGCGAQAAFINSGSLRLNQDLPAGPSHPPHVEELFAYPTPLYLLKIDGATLKQVAEQAIRGWPGSGNWLQIAGFAFVHDPNARHRPASDPPAAGAAPRRCGTTRPSSWSPTTTWSIPRSATRTATPC